MRLGRKLGLKTSLICLDESGGFRAEAPLVIGTFLTNNQKMIREMINYSRSLHTYPYELHFSKISANPEDKRFKTSKTLFKALIACEKDWQARVIFSNDDSEINKWNSLTPAEFYDRLIEQLILRFGGWFLGKKAVFIIDESNIAKCNNFIPDQLSILLNKKMKRITGTKFNVKMGNSSSNDFLQLADLFSGAVRQLYVPSNNKNKIELAETILPVLFKGNGQIQIIKAS